jgi:hypothetical protein
MKCRILRKRLEEKRTGGWSSIISEHWLNSYTLMKIQKAVLKMGQLFLSPFLFSDTPPAGEGSKQYSSFI